MIIHLCDFSSLLEMAKSISYVISVLDIVGCQSYKAINQCTKKREAVTYDGLTGFFFSNIKIMGFYFFTNIYILQKYSTFKEIFTFILKIAIK